MKTLTTPQELVEFFDKFTLSFRGTLMSRTPVKMNKKDLETKTISNPYGDVYKIQLINMELNADYEAKVNSARREEDKKDDFVVEERMWGSHVNGVIVQKGEQLYINVLEESKIGPVKYETENGVSVDYNNIKPFLPIYKSPPKQNLENDVKVRTFKVANVLEMSIPTIDFRYIAS
jgi:hypothetical protein